VLLQNFHDMRGFLVIVFTIIFAAAIMFFMLFATHPCVQDKACFNDMVDAYNFDDTAKGLTSFQSAVLTMFNAGVFGVFSVNGFDDTASPL